MRKIILFFIFILLVNVVSAAETKSDVNYKVTFLIGSGVTTDYDDIKVSSVAGEKGVGNYTDGVMYLIKRGMLYVLNIVAETTPPTISNLINTSTTNESSFIEWSCSENCNYSILWFNNSIRNNTYLVNSIYNNTFKTSHNPYLANLTNSTTYFINLTVWDVSGNSAADNTFNFATAKTIVVDTIHPTYSNFANNASTVTKVNGVVNWSITLQDETGLSFYIFAHNNSGTLLNVSNGTLSGTSVFVNKTVTITKGQGNYICGQFWVNDTSDNINQTNMGCFTVANTAPTIPYVESGISAIPTGGTTTIVYFTFNASDEDGASDINVSSASVNITLNAPGGQSRDNTSCTNIATSGNVVQFNCSVKFYYYDNSSSSWVINATIYDNSNVIGINDSVIFTYNSLSAMDLVTASLAFSNAVLGQENKTSDSPIILNNTGNFKFNDISITGYDLTGVSNSNYKIGVGNFTVNVTNATVGAGLQLQNGTSLLISGAKLRQRRRNQATAGNTSLYFWLDIPSSSEIILQSYNSTASWTVTVE